MVEKGPGGFDLVEWIMRWYEQEIPVDQIPEEYQQEVPLPGGGTQIIDTRVPGWTYHPDVGKMLVCPEVWLDDMDP